MNAEEDKSLRRHVSGKDKPKTKEYNLAPDVHHFGLHPPSCSCGESLVFIGPTFAPPKKKDDKAWARVGKLIRAGYVFSPCESCNGDGNKRALERLGVTSVAELK